MTRSHDLASQARSADADVYDKSSTLAELIRWHSRTIPHAPVFTYLDHRVSSEQSITFSQLDARSATIATRLRTLGEPGDRVLLLYDSGIEYICALIACFYAGMIAVPVYPPDRLRMQRTFSRLQLILQDAQATIVLSSREILEWTEPLLAESQVAGQFLATDEIETSALGNVSLPPVSADSLALLQYTSGSTGSPKGVMLTHGNLYHCLAHFKEFDEPGAVGVSWLPMYHDMGLMGAVLQVLYSGRRLILLSPLAVMQSPFRWLEAISRFRAMMTGGPNFAFELCVRKISEEDKAKLDLSCLSIVANGSEPIRVETIELFCNAFASCGFRRESFYPCYGLAEATLIVSGPAQRAAPKIRSFEIAELDRRKVVPADPSLSDARKLVGCGQPVRGSQVLIVDPDRCLPCAADEIGEIWVSSPSVGRGYWRRPELSQATFQARLATGEGPFLRTGDLGFFTAGELFVAGRLKDLIIIQGRNFFPQDIELTVEKCHKNLRSNSGVAFSIEGLTSEKLVVVQEIARPNTTDLPRVVERIRSEIAHEYDLVPSHVILIRSGSIPKTSSGKLQRSACRQAFEAGTLKVVFSWQSPTDASAETSESSLVMLEPASAMEERDDARAIRKIRQHSGNGRAAHNSPSRSATLAELSRILVEMRKITSPTVVNSQTLLMGELGLVSSDLMLLQDELERFYGVDLPFHEFMLDLGRRQVRDIELGELAEFLRRYLEDRQFHSADLD